MTTPKVGPLTPAEFQAIWESTSDPSYVEPFERAGEGNGFEAHTQAWQQFARVSRAIDETTQAMFILPWSGQSAPPARGAQKATVELTLTRTKLLNLPLVLQAGTFVEEQATDWGPSGGVPVLTGRRYALAETVVFEPGQQGPLTATATAERPGWGYNNPQPGTITVVDQPGTQYTNSGAVVRSSQYVDSLGNLLPGDPQARAQVFVDAAPLADSFVPQHVGQYLIFNGGFNFGTIARILSYSGPDLATTPPTGGTVTVELVESVRSPAGQFSGTFQVGEVLSLDSGAAWGVLLDAQVIGGALFLTFRKTSNKASTSVAGQSSGASATFGGGSGGTLLVDVEFNMETDAFWTILDWVADWGLSVTNAAQPSGGRAAMLDALGKERAIFRASPGEGDDAYAQRVATIADVVTPNAIARGVNAVLVPLGIPWLFFEAGTTFAGVYYDQDAYDIDVATFGGTVTGTFLDGEKVSQTDPTTGKVASGYAGVSYPLPASVPGPPSGPPTLYGVVAPRGTFVTGAPVVGAVSGASITPTSVTGGAAPQGFQDRVLFGYENMRAWFYVAIPPDDLGDPGFAYDSGASDAYDCAPFLAFYDGQPWGFARQCLALARVLDGRRAGGVGWDLLLATSSAMEAYDATATSAVA